MSKVFSKILILFLFLAIPKSLLSQTNLMNKLLEPWRWTRFTTEQGLPSNQIIGLYESLDGTIWAFTTTGVAYFNGYSWVTPKNGAKDFDNFVHIDDYPGNRLLYSTDYKLLAMDKEQTWGIPLSYNNKEIRVQSILSSKNGAMLIHGTLYGENHGNIFYISPMGKVSIWNKLPKNIWITTENSIYKSNDGYYFLNTLGKLFVITPSFECAQIFDSKSDNTIIIDKPHVYIDGSIDYFISSPVSLKGFWHYDPKIKESKKVSSATFLSNVYFNNERSLGIGLMNGEIVGVFENNEWSYLSDANQVLETGNAILFAKNGDLWVGNSEGVSICRLSSRRFTNILLNESKPNEINEIIKSKKKQGSYFAAGSNGVYCITQNDKFQPISLNNPKLKNLTALEEDDQGRLWVASGSDDIGIWMFANGKWSNQCEKLKTQASKVHKIKKDQKGNLWMLVWAEKKNSSVCILKVDNKLYCTRYDIDPKYEVRKIYSIDFNENNEVYVGANNGILKLINGKFVEIIDNKNDITNRDVFALSTSPKGIVSFANRSSTLKEIINDACGQNKYDSATVYGIWNIKYNYNNDLWATSSNGVYICKDQSVGLITKRNGLKRNFIWALLVDSNKTYLGVNGAGISILDHSERSHPLPIILFNQPITKEGNVSVSWKTFSWYGEIPFDDIEVRYRIDEGEWSKWSKIRIWTNDTISSGAHTIEIQAKNLFGDFNKKPFTISFYVPEPYYAKPTFYAPASAVLCFLSLLAAQYFLRRREFVSELNKANANMNAFIENTPDSIAILDANLNFVLFNSAYQEFVNKVQLQKIKAGDNFYLTISAVHRNSWEKLFEEALNGEIKVFEQTIAIESAIKHFNTTLFPIYESGEAFGIAIFLSDVTKRIEMENQIKASLREKEILLKEIHHRVKNNMQVIANLLGLQAIATDDKKIADILEVARARIVSMALVHEKLYRIGDLRKIDFNDYIRSLVDTLKNSYTPQDKDIKIEAISNDVELTVEAAMPCGLIINELVTNSLKYAFKNRANGEILVSLKKKKDDWYELEISDNGVGLPENIEINPMKSLGLFLVSDLATRQLKGEFNMSNSSGANFKIRFRDVAPKADFSWEGVVKL